MVSNQRHERGFVYVASLSKRFLLSACLSAESLRDYHPTANITLFTTPDLLDGTVDVSVFDDIITDGVPQDRRAKLWALSRSPYKTTAYLDADTFVVSSEVSTMFDQLGENDLIFTKIRPYNSNPKGFIEDPGYIYHGGVFVYNDAPDTIRFMERWWELWSTTRFPGIFTETYPEFPERMRDWDQFYLFFLINHTEHNLKIGFFENDARWNFVVGYLKSELNGLPAIIEHYTLKPL